MADFSIVTVDAENFEQHGLFCVGNRKHPGYVAKRDWLAKRFRDGLRFKMIYGDGSKPLGFVEYIPAEQSWRVVENAEGFLMIHCLWVKSEKTAMKGLAGELLQSVRREADVDGKKGVAVVASAGSWMAGSDVFIKNGFRETDSKEPYALLINGNQAGPSFPTNWQQRLKSHKGLELLFTNQCPYIGKAVNELPAVAGRFGIRLTLTEIKDAREARSRMASPYGMVNLLYDEQLLADHAISATRFRNILQKDLGLKELN